MVHKKLLSFFFLFSLFFSDHLLQRFLALTCKEKSAVCFCGSMGDLIWLVFVFKDFLIWLLTAFKRWNKQKHCWWENAQASRQSPSGRSGWGELGWGREARGKRTVLCCLGFCPPRHLSTRVYLSIVSFVILYQGLPLKVIDWDFGGEGLPSTSLSNISDSAAYSFKTAHNHHLQSLKKQCTFPWLVLVSQ